MDDFDDPADLDGDGNFAALLKDIIHYDEVSENRIFTC